MDKTWEGHIAGVFEGYAGGRVYELSDGTRWRQEGRTSEYVYRERPGASRHRRLALSAPPGHNGRMNRIGTVTASKTANWAYCPESWRLADLGHEPAPAARVEARQSPPLKAEIAVAAIRDRE